MLREFILSERSLLIIDDDQIMCGLITECLESDFSSITHCQSIALAIDLLMENEYDCLIIDIDLGDGNGAEVVKYIQDWKPMDNHEATKIVISGFVNDVFKEKFKDKFDGILAKPFKPGDLQATVLVALGKRKKSHAPKKNLSLISPDVNESHEASPTLANESQGTSGAIGSRAKPGKDLKLKFDDEDIDLKVFDPKIHAPFKLENLDKRVGKTLKKIQQNTKLKEVFKKIKIDPDDPYMMSHIGLLINISTGICHFLDWGSDQTLEKFVFAAYLHDLALGDSAALARIDNLDELEHGDHGFSQHEKDLVRLHSAASKQMIEHKSGIPEDVLTIIEQHHERPNGRGFPRGIDHKRITPLSSIFIISHWLADFIIKDKHWSVDKFYMKYKSQLKGPHFRKAMRAIESLR